MIYLTDNSSLWEFVHLDDLPSLITQFYISKYNANLVYAATPDGFLIIDKNCLGLNTFSIKDEPKQDRIKIYPNPVTDEAFLLVKIPESVSQSMLSVYDTKGALITKLNPNDTNGFVRLNTTAYAAGMYLVELHFEDVKVDNTKFIVNP